MSKTLELLLKRKQEILAELSEIELAIKTIDTQKHNNPAKVSESIIHNSGYDTSSIDDDINPMHSIGYGRGDK